jgi:hypothetical protein
LERISSRFGNPWSDCSMGVVTSSSTSSEVSPRLRV